MMGESPELLPPQEAPRGISQRDLVWLGLIGLALILIRLHAFDLPLETDECNYAYTASRLLEGEKLYVDVWDHQPFGVFVLFAAVIGVFGDDPVVFRSMATVFSLVSMLLVFGILRRISGRGAAVSGAALFAIVSADPGTAGEGCNREIFMNTLVLAGWYLALIPAKKPAWPVVLSGTALAVGSAIKTIVAVHWLMLAIFLVVAAARGVSVGSRFRAATKTLLWFALGPAVLWLGALLYFAVTARSAEFIDAVFLFNLGYAGGEEAFSARFIRFFGPERFVGIFRSALPLWWGGAAASLYLFYRVFARRDSKPMTILLMVMAGFLAICLPGRFWPHYYYLLIPPLVIAVSAAVGELVARMVEWKGPSARRAVLLLSILPCLLGVTEWRHYLSQPPFGITVDRYNSRDFWGRGMGEKVAEVTEPNDTIFVYGSDTAVYYYSQRRCASRYTMITGLSAAYEGVDQRRDELMADLRRAKPRIVLVLADEPPFSDWIEFINQDYYRAGWDCHDRYRETCSAPDPSQILDQIIMQVFVLKDRPIESANWDWDRSEVGGWLRGEAPAR